MRKMPVNSSSMSKSSISSSSSGNGRRRSDELTINEKKKADLILEASTTNANHYRNHPSSHSNHIIHHQLDDDDENEDHETKNWPKTTTSNVQMVDINLNLPSDLSDESSSSSSLSSPPPPLFLIDNEQLNAKFKQNSKKNVFQPQHLDNFAIQHLIDDQNRSHLIIDDNECLKVKSSTEFISLFKTNLNKLSPMSSDSSSLSPDHSLQDTDLASNNIGGTAQGSEDKLVKCVAIFGNTGDGKSHTLNNTFFNGRNIFCTSQKQETCTVGVWCAFDSNTNSLIFDTEGLLGTTANDNKRMRLLLKVLAICDVIIYRTRAERLHNDLFEFLSNASVAYLKYFKEELKIAAGKLKLETISTLGPCCVIFHETQHTDVLSDVMDSGGVRSVTQQINDRFAKLELNNEAFSSIEYVGTRTSPGQSTQINTNKYNSTDFTKLASTVRDLLKNNSVRSPRKLSSIYQLLKVLNDKFNGTINKTQLSTFADEYFTCSSVCLSCGKRCQNSINHFKDSILHSNSDKCHYDHQYDNKVYVCKLCHEAGREVIVHPKTSAANENSFIGIVKYTCSGYVLECPHHGVIYRSRQYWYNNPEPESVVRTELKHIWSGQLNNVGTSHNLSRKIIDNVSYIGESLQNVSAKPTMIAKQWMADQVAPSYWTPNSEIVDCFKCKKAFNDVYEKKHHCRGCGKGFCDKCSLKRKIISWWSTTDKVRVCDACFDKQIIPEPKPPVSQLQSTASSSSLYMNNNNSNNSISSSTNSLGLLSLSGNNDMIARKVTEAVQETVGLIGYATKLPLDAIKESARPSYWKPDPECIKCALCKKDFDEINLLHHCRSCGNGVCHACSPHLRPVISRGWETPVRVCDNCVQNENVS